MAGVGFRLTKMFYKGRISTDLLAIAYSIMLSSGPWIITTLSLWIILNTLNITNMYFNIALVYSFVFSIIISSLFTLFESRRISDLIYLKEYKKIFPEVLGMIFYCSLLMTILLLIFFSFNHHELWFVFSFSYLSISLSILWIISVASISTEAVNWYIIAYLIMGFSSIVLSKILGSEDNPMGYILGYAFGVNIGTFVHSLITILHFGTEVNIFSNLLGEVKKYWQNIFIGFIYYSALWADDIITWYSKTYGEEPLKGFHFSYIYDYPMFLAYLTIIPTATMFVLILETRFYKTYKLFYDSLVEGHSYSEIELRKNSMLKELKLNISLTIKVQVVITTILMLLNELDLLPFIPEISKPILRLGLIGAMMNSFYLMIMLLLLYFDFRNSVLYLNMFVFAMNVILSLLFIDKVGYYALGAGYSLAFTFGTFIGYRILTNRVNDIIQIEYFRQRSAIKKGFYIHYNEIKKEMED